MSASSSSKVPAGPFHDQEGQSWNDEDCTYMLRCLERDAFSALVSAFRAQGPMTEYVSVVLEHVKAALFITDEMFRAEVRRATNDHRLAKIAGILNPSYDTYAEWAYVSMEHNDFITARPVTSRPFASSSTLNIADAALEAAAKFNEKVHKNQMRLCELLDIPEAPYVPERLRLLLRETSSNPKERVLPASELVKSAAADDASILSPSTSRAPASGSRAPVSGSRAPASGSRAPASGSRAPASGSRAPSARPPPAKRLRRTKTEMAAAAQKGAVAQQLPPTLEPEQRSTEQQQKEQKEVVEKEAKVVPIPMASNGEAKPNGSGDGNGREEPGCSGEQGNGLQLQQHMPFAVITEAAMAIEALVAKEGARKKMKKEMEEGETEKKEEEKERETRARKVEEEMEESGTTKSNGGVQRRRRSRPRPEPKGDTTLTAARVCPFIFPPQEPGQPKPPRGNPDKRSTKRPSNNNNNGFGSPPPSICLLPPPSLSAPSTSSTHPAFIIDPTTPQPNNNTNLMMPNLLAFPRTSPTTTSQRALTPTKPVGGGGRAQSGFLLPAPMTSPIPRVPRMPGRQEASPGHTPVQHVVTASILRRDRGDSRLSLSPGSRMVVEDVVPPLPSVQTPSSIGCATVGGLARPGALLTSPPYKRNVYSNTVGMARSASKFYATTRTASPSGSQASVSSPSTPSTAAAHNIGVTAAQHTRILGHERPAAAAPLSVSSHRISAGSGVGAPATTTTGPAHSVPTPSGSAHSVSTPSGSAHLVPTPSGSAPSAAAAQTLNVLAPEQYGHDYGPPACQAPPPPQAPLTGASSGSLPVGGIPPPPPSHQTSQPLTTIGSAHSVPTPSTTQAPPPTPTTPLSKQQSVSASLSAIASNATPTTTVGQALAAAHGVTRARGGLNGRRGGRGVNGTARGAAGRLATAAAAAAAGTAGGGATPEEPATDEKVAEKVKSIMIDAAKLENANGSRSCVARDVLEKGVNGLHGGRLMKSNNALKQYAHPGVGKQGAGLGNVPAGRAGLGKVPTPPATHLQAAAEQQNVREQEHVGFRPFRLQPPQGSMATSHRSLFKPSTPVYSEHCVDKPNSLKVMAMDGGVLSYSVAIEEVSSTGQRPPPPGVPTTPRHPAAVATTPGYSAGVPTMSGPPPRVPTMSGPHSGPSLPQGPHARRRYNSQQQVHAGEDLWNGLIPPRIQAVAASQAVLDPAEIYLNGEPAAAGGHDNVLAAAARAAGLDDCIMMMLGGGGGEEGGYGPTTTQEEVEGVHGRTHCNPMPVPIDPPHPSKSNRRDIPPAGEEAAPPTGFELPPPPPPTTSSSGGTTTAPTTISTSIDPMSTPIAIQDILQQSVMEIS